MSVQERHICITGCSRGLGRALALGFVREGWRVSGCARSAEGLEALRDEMGGDSTLVPCDVADDSSVEAFARSVIEAEGAPDLLVNNAAIINRNAPLWELTAEEFSDIVDINLKGVVSCIRHFTPAMIERGTGIIINLSSGWGRTTSPEVASYCATKFAVEGLSASMAQELPAGLATAALNPGIIDTDLLRICWSEGAGSYEDADSWARRAVPYLAGLDASCNGRRLTVG